MLPHWVIVIVKHKTGNSFSLTFLVPFYQCGKTGKIGWVYENWAGGLCNRVIPFFFSGCSGTTHSELPTYCVLPTLQD
jgi:hypothetical protein